MKTWLSSLSHQEKPRVSLPSLAPNSLKLSSVRTPKVFLLSYPTQDHSCWGGCTGAGTLDNIRHGTRSKAWLTGASDLPFPSPHNSKPQQLWPTWLSTNKGQHGSRAFSPPDIFQIFSAVSTSPFSSSSYCGFDAQEIFFKSSHGHGCGAELSPSDHSLSALQQSRFWIPSAQRGWESHGWTPIYEIPDNAVQQEPTFCCSLAVSIYSIPAFGILLFIPKLSVLWPWEITCRTRATQRRKPKQNKTFINLSLMHLFPFPSPQEEMVGAGKGEGQSQQNSLTIKIWVQLLKAQSIFKWCALMECCCTSFDETGVYLKRQALSNVLLNPVCQLEQHQGFSGWEKRWQ